MIKSTKTTLKFSNTNKKNDLKLFINEYRKVVEIFANKLWNLDKIPNLLPKTLTNNIETWLSQRAIQCAGKQASGIVRGTKQKQKQTLFIINKLKEQGCFKKARKLQTIYNNKIISKPNINIVQPELDSRFVKINLEKTNSFDGWISLTSLGNKLKILLPIKQHKHFNEMLSKGKIKNGIRLSSDTATLMFDLNKPKVRENGNILGIDIGKNTTLSCSNGQSIDQDKHKHNYSSICKKLARKEKGSKAFLRTVKHRTNYINWCVKQINLTNVKTVNRENIKYLRKNKRGSRLMSHWNYAELFEKLDSKLGDAGVQITKLNPTYTSQRCSTCGWVRKGNRKGKLFKCDKCSFEHDADLNASNNISLDLLPIGKAERLQQKNKTGFYWFVAGQERIVPVALKPYLEEISIK